MELNNAWDKSKQCVHTFISPYGSYLKVKQHTLLRNTQEAGIVPLPSWAQPPIHVRTAKSLTSVPSSLTYHLTHTQQVMPPDPGTLCHAARWSTNWTSEGQHTELQTRCAVTSTCTCTCRVATWYMYMVYTYMYSTCVWSLHYIVYIHVCTA